MKKSLLVVGVAAMLVGCGGATTSDIEDAARQLDAQESASGLRLAVGQTWDATEARVTTNQYGSVSTDGKFKELTASKSTDDETWAHKSKVIKTTYVEAADKNGYVVEMVRRKTSGKSTTGSVSVDETLSNLDERSSEVLFEFDGWVRELSENMVADADLNPGAALHPLAPKSNAVYVTDHGNVWKADGVESVGAFKAVVLTRQQTPDLYKIEDFYKDCFEVTAGAAPASSDVKVKGACLGNQIKAGEAVFTKERTSKLYVGRQLILKSVVKTDLIRLDQLVCTEGSVVTERTFNAGLTSCAGSISLGRLGGPEEQVIEQTMEVTAIGRDADRTALPEITTEPAAE